MAHIDIVEETRKRVTEAQKKRLDPNETLRLFFNDSVSVEECREEYDVFSVTSDLRAAVAHRGKDVLCIRVQRKHLLACPETESFAYQKLTGALTLEAADSAVLPIGYLVGLKKYRGKLVRFEWDTWHKNIPVC